jgi:hypothetical protein
MIVDGSWPLSWWAILGFEPVTSSVSNARRWDLAGIQEVHGSLGWGPPRSASGRVAVQACSRDLQLLRGDKHAPSPKRRRGVHDRIDPARPRVEWEPKLVQGSGFSPIRRPHAITGGEVLGKASEEDVPTFIARTGRLIGEEARPSTGTLPSILFQELRDQTPPPCLVNLHEQRGELSQRQRLIRWNRTSYAPTRVQSHVPRWWAILGLNQ